MSTTELPLPTFYDPRSAERWGHAPDQQALFAAAAAWRKQHDLKSAAADRERVHLCLIDVQKDFCFPQGSLYVAGRSGRGAVDDSRRIAEFVYQNLGAITDITATMDTHFAYQIFFASFWVTGDDQPVAAHREITTAQIDAGQAASHCVKSSIDDILSEIVATDPALAKKVHLLTDCMSAVTVPDGRGGLAADFTGEADAALARFAAAGMKLCKSTDRLSAWLR